MKKRTPLTFHMDKVTPAQAAPATEQTPKRARPQTKPGRDGRQFIAAHVLPDAAKQFKLLAVQNDKTTQDLLIEAINDLFAKYGLSRIA
jgi:hypothetical protein